MGSRRWLFPLAALGAVLAYVGLRRGELPRAWASMRRFDVPSARLYDALLGPLSEPFFAGIARDVAALNPSGAALDLGCGPGRLVMRIARSVPDLTVVGLDIAPDMIELARKRAADAGITDGVRFEMGDAAAMPFPDQQFDLVVSTFSQHHWAEPERVLAEIHRVLKPEGVACVYDLAGWILRGALHGTGLSHLAETGPLTGGKIETVSRFGPFPAIRRLHWRREAR